MENDINEPNGDSFFSHSSSPLGEETKVSDGEASLTSFAFTTKEGRNIEVQTLKDLISTVPQEREYMVEGLAPTSGLGILGGPPKRGKSTMLIHLARSIATGQPFLDRETQRRPAIYVNYEMPLDYFAELSGAGEVPDNFCVIDRPEPRLQPQTVRAIIDAVGERGFPRGLLMIDSFRGAFKLRAEQENQSGEAGTILRELQEIAVQTGWFIFIVHHHRKNASQEGAANLSGTGDFSAASDVIWTWTRPIDASKPGTMEIEGRLPPVDPLVVQLSPDECKYAGPFSPDGKREEEEHRILEVASKERLTAREIEARTHIPYSTIQKRLASLQNQKLVDCERSPGKGSPKIWFARTASQ